MTLSHQITCWREGPVNRSYEHMELRYGRVADGGWDEWLPVALVGPPVDGAVNVQFLVDRLSPENSEIIAHLLREIQFYLIDKCEIPRPDDFDPWAYARYHCGTMSNVYSTIHWSYFAPGAHRGGPYSVRMPDGQLGWWSPDDNLRPDEDDF